MAGRPQLYNVVVLGGGGVGKTSFVIQFCLGRWTDEYDPTIEDSYITSTIVDGMPCQLDVMDTAGQEEYAAMRAAYIQGGQAFILVYSITDSKSYSMVSELHHQMMNVWEGREDGTPPICLVGNKSDDWLRREITTQQGFEIAKEMNCAFFEVSSKLSRGTSGSPEAPFHWVIRELRKQHAAASQKEPRSFEILRDAASMSQNYSHRRHDSMSSRFSSLTKRFLPASNTDRVFEPQEITRQSTLDELLVKAVRRNKRKTAEKLLGLGADPNGDANNDGSALFAAAALGHSKLITLLIDNKAAVNARSKRGFTPLMIAAAEGHIDAVKMLLARGALPNVLSDVHGTPLIAATFRCHTAVMSILLQNGANVGEEGGQYDTALHTAATVGNPTVAEILLDAGANIRDRNRDDCTALQVAAAAGHTSVVRLLLLRGARALLDDTQGKYGSALKAANDKSRFEVMKILIEAGADEKTMNIPPQTKLKPHSTNAPNAVTLDTDENFGILENVTEPTAKDDSTLMDHKTDRERLASPPRLQDTIRHLNSEQSSFNVLPEMASPSSPSYEASQKLDYNDLGTASHPLGDSPDLTVRRKPLEELPHYDYEGPEDVPWEVVGSLKPGSSATLEIVKPRGSLESRVTYARKSFSLHPRFRRKLVPIIHNEVSVLKAARHHHVSQICSTYSTRSEFAIIMPLADMNLQDYLESYPRPTGDSPIYSWFGCLATGFDYLHQRKIKHQDVKPANILIRDGRVLIADFGISKNVIDEDTTGSTGPVARTLMYCAPEVATAEVGTRRGRKADMFSLGCVFLDMISALLWTHGSSVQRLHDQIRVNDTRVYSAALEKVLQWIMMMFALDRAGTAEIAHTTALQWCLAMLLKDPDRRISARDLKIAIERYQSWTHKPSANRERSASPSWIGACCKSRDYGEIDLTEPGVMHSWPALTLDSATLGLTAWVWEDITGRMTFNLSESPE